MTKFEQIQEIIRKGFSLTPADIDDIEAHLATMELDEAHRVEPWIWEAVALIVNDEQYKGDAKVPEVDEADA